MPHLVEAKSVTGKPVRFPSDVYITVMSGEARECRFKSQSQPEPSILTFNQLLGLTLIVSRDYAV